LKCSQGSEKESNMKKHMPHMFMMVLCCGLPVLLLFLVPLIASANPALGAKLLPVIPFLCPVLMGGMMFFMFKKEKNTVIKENDNKNETDV